MRLEMVDLRQADGQRLLAAWDACRPRVQPFGWHPIRLPEPLHAGMILDNAMRGLRVILAVELVANDSDAARTISWEGGHRCDFGRCDCETCLGRECPADCPTCTNKIGADRREAAHPDAWLHMSVSHRKRIPTWEEMVECKRYFMGDRKAISVLPVEAEYFNHCPRCLHLFASLDYDPLPDLRLPNGTL